MATTMNSSEDDMYFTPLKLVNHEADANEKVDSAMQSNEQVFAKPIPVSC